VKETASHLLSVTRDEEGEVGRVSADSGGAYPQLSHLFFNSITIA